MTFKREIIERFRCCFPDTEWCNFRNYVYNHLLMKYVKRYNLPHKIESVALEYVGFGDGFYCGTFKVPDFVLCVLSLDSQMQFEHTGNILYTNDSEPKALCFVFDESILDNIPEDIRKKILHGCNLGLDWCLLTDVLEE